MRAVVSYQIYSRIYFIHYNNLLPRSNETLLLAESFDCHIDTKTHEINFIILLYFGTHHEIWNRAHNVVRCSINSVLEQNVL